MNEIKVSVIVYVKNTVDYIEQCVRSVMNQTLQEIEILIIDGGSTDGTLEILEKLKSMDCRIRIFHSPASVGTQFNLGLRKARGQYIGICEADDYILPEMYERQYRIAKENRLDVLRACYYQIFHIRDKEYRFQVEGCFQKELTGKVVVSDQNAFFLKQGINGFWNGIYRRQFLLDNHIWMNETKGAAYQDITFSFLTQMYARRIWFMEDAFYCYRADNPNASVNSPQGVALHRKEYEELKKCLKILERWETYKNIFFSWELMCYRSFVGNLPSDLRMENAKKVYQKLKEQMDAEAYEIENVMESVRGLAESLLGGASEFVQCILSGTENKEEMLAYVKNSMKCDEMVILFGVGHLGNLVKRFLEWRGKEVLLTDNSGVLQRDGLLGQVVHKPEDLATWFPNGRYIIANVRHAAEMQGQLLALGIRRENILICDDEDFFLRKIFVNEGQILAAKGD